MSIKTFAAAAAILAASTVGSFAGSFVNGQFDPASSPRDVTEYQRANLASAARGAVSSELAVVSDPAYKPRAQTEIQRSQLDTVISTNDSAVSGAGLAYDPVLSTFFAAPGYKQAYTTRD